MYRKVLSVLLLITFLSNTCCFAITNKEINRTKKVRKQEAKDRYKKKKMPESGYMTMEEYEKKSVSKDKREGNGDFIPKIKDSNMKYVPQPKYKLIRYNVPPGTAELNLQRKVHFDRQEVMPGIISPDTEFMVIPIVSYYAKTDSTDCDLYIVPLKKGMPDVEKVIKANIAQKDPVPILSTSRYPVEYGTFRTLTPVDFSLDKRYLIIKEKTGNTGDGIWQTEIYTYDFETKQVHKAREIRDAIRYYWKTTKNLDVKDIRWDIYPMGFDAVNKDRIVVTAYAYAGNPPRSLGTWSIDAHCNQVRMESLTDQNLNVSTIGLKIVEDGIEDPKSVVAESKIAKKYEKKKKKEAKKEIKKKKKELKREYKAEIKKINKNYNALKKEDNSSLSKVQKVNRVIPTKITTSGGKLTGGESVKD